jgi:hypothetical protein
MNEYLKNRSKLKIDFSADRGLSKKLPPLKAENNIILNPDNDYELNTLQSTEPVKPPVKEIDNSPFLNGLFDHAFDLTSKRLLEQKQVLEAIAGSESANVSMDLYHSGTNNACLAFGLSLKRMDSPVKGKRAPMIIDEFIGNIGAISFTDENDSKFAKKFQLMLESAFKCFGKRYNQLSKDEMKVPVDAGFKIAEKNQFAAVKFDDENVFTAGVIITKFIQYTLKSFNDPSVLNKKIKELCITFPSDFDTVQRNDLRECLNLLSIKKCNLITKPIAIAAPILIQNPDVDKKNLVIDFSSGVFYFKKVCPLF